MIKLDQLLTLNKNAVAEIKFQKDSLVVELKYSSVKVGALTKDVRLKESMIFNLKEQLAKNEEQLRRKDQLFQKSFRQVAHKATAVNENDFREVCREIAV